MQPIDQRQLWDDKHARGEHASYVHEPVNFALDAEKDFPRNSTVLDLGCGIGADAEYFAQENHIVEAIDFSSIVIEQNNKRSHRGVTYSTFDISQALPYDSQSFDVVYAHLSIHYFSDSVTRGIIKEVARVLKPRGKFYFRCKSINSDEKNVSTQIEPGIFVSNDTGHIRHLFSLEYTADILRGRFTVHKLEETQEKYRKNVSIFVDCWAEKAI